MAEHHTRPGMRLIQCMQAKLLTSSPLLQVTPRGQEFLRPIIEKLGWEVPLAFLPHSERIERERQNAARRPAEKHDLSEVLTRLAEGSNVEQPAPADFVERFVRFLRSDAAEDSVLGKALGSREIQVAVAVQLDDFGVAAAHFERVLGAHVFARVHELGLRRTYARTEASAVGHDVA